jgi:hypothetical protein
MSSESQDMELMQYCIKGSVNSAYSGQYISDEMVKYVLSRGCRFLDFEVYYLPIGDDEDEKDEKTGYWRIFNLQGDLIGIENYRYGQKNGLQQYFSINGNLIKEESWLAHNPENPTEMVEVYDINDPNKVYMVEVKLDASAVPHGLWKYYEAGSGSLIKKENFILGKLDDGSGTGNGMIKKDEKDAAAKDADTKTETKEKPKEKPKPREVMDFEKKNEGKKKVKIRTGATG